LSALPRQKRRAIAANIIFQRTELGRLSRKPWLKRFWSYEELVRFDGALYGGRVINEYLQCMEREWRTLEAWVPKGAAYFLDIGCGVAGIHQWTYRHFCENEDESAGDGRSYSLTLCDRDSSCDRVYYDFNARGAAYNDLDLSRVFLESFGIPARAIEGIDADRDRLPFERKFDLIMSLISWGFHYPIETYLDYARQQLAEEGVMIVDCRRGTSGLSSLEEYFDTKIIVEGAKHDRLLCKHR